MSLSIRWTNQFKKDYKKVQKSGLDINKLKDVINRYLNKHLYLISSLDKI